MTDQSRLNNPAGLATPALGAGLSLAFFASPWFVPLLGMLFSVFTPAPLVLVYRRMGTKAGRLGVLLTLGAALAVFQFSPVRLGGLYFLYYAAAAVVLGETWEYRVREDWAVALAGLSSSFCLFALFWFVGLFSGGDLATAWQAQWERELSLVISAYKSAGLDPNQAAGLKRDIMQTVKVLFRLAPSILAGISLVLAWVNLLVVRRLSAVLAPKAAPYLGRLTTFRAPFFLVWALIAAGVLTVLLPGWLSWVGANVLVLVGLIYFFQGVAVLAHFFERKNLPRFIRVGVYVLIALEVRLALLLAVAGLFDIWFNFRKLGRDNTG